MDGAENSVPMVEGVSPPQAERRKSSGNLMRRKSSVSSVLALRRASVSSAKSFKSTKTDGIQLQDELQREMLEMERMEEALKAKWRSALETHKENFKLNLEKQKRDTEEMQRNKTLVEEVRAQRDQKKVMSVLANLEEKKEKVDEFKKRRITIVEEARKEEQRKEQNKRAWISMMRDVKSLQKEKKRELEEERKRQFSMTLERQNSIKEKLERRKSEARKSQVEWERRLSTFQLQKKAEKKKYKKRLRPPTESENRFKRLQREAKMRALREEARLKQLEHEQLMKKRQRYFQELARRAEARARLEHLRKCQQLNDFRQSVAMDRVRKEYEARVAVQKAEKLFTENVVEMFKKNDKYLRGLRRKAVNEKKKKAKAEKIKREVDRCAAVAEKVKKHHALVNRLALQKGQQMAEEEIQFLKTKEEQKEFNDWVAEQYHRKAALLRRQERFREYLRKQEVQRQQLLKKEAELERRKETLRQIQYLAENRAEPLNETLSTEAGEAVRRKVLEMRNEGHRKLLEEAQQRKVQQGDQVRQQLLKAREVYLKDRNADYKDKQKQKEKVVRKAQKLAWR